MSHAELLAQVVQPTRAAFRHGRHGDDLGSGLQFGELAPDLFELPLLLLPLLLRPYVHLLPLGLRCLQRAELAVQTPCDA